MKKLLMAASFIFLFSAIGAAGAQTRKSVSAEEKIKMQSRIATVIGNLLI